MPDLVVTYRWLSLSLVVGVAGIALATAAFRRVDFPVRPAAQLMGLLFAMLGLLSALFIGWDLTRTRAVVVAEDYLILGNDTVRAADVERAYLETVSDYTMMGDPDVDTVGVLELTDGRLQLFDNDQYPVRRLILRIRQLRGGAAE